jgi:hypothetical protein
MKKLRVLAIPVLKKSLETQRLAFCTWQFCLLPTALCLVSGFARPRSAIKNMTKKPSLPVRSIEPDASSS